MDMGEGYICLLQLLYQSHQGSILDSDRFTVQRGLKQGDVLSVVIFNCVLDMAFDRQKDRLSSHVLFIAHAISRLANTRYAYDILLYAKSLDELIIMVESLIEELALIQLTLNAKKTKILCSEVRLESYRPIDFVEIMGEFMEILDTNQFHRYLGRHPNLSTGHRLGYEIRYRK